LERQAFCGTPSPCQSPGRIAAEPNRGRTDLTVSGEAVKAPAAPAVEARTQTTPHAGNLD